MHNSWLVAKYEYRRIVGRRGFLLGTLAIPFFLILIIVVMVLFVEGKSSKLPLGYVDQSGLLANENLVSEGESENQEEAVQQKFIAYLEESSAQAALKNGEIQAYFVFPSDYPANLQTDLYYLSKPPDASIWSQFDDLVRARLVSKLAEPVQKRLLEGSHLTVIDLNNNRRFSPEGVVNIILPIVVSFFFFAITLSASTYMLQVVSDEKENRTMEVMITSLSPGQLITGKAMGLIATAMTQLAIYILAGLICLKIAAGRIAGFQYLTIPWDYILVMVLFFFPTFALLAAIMIAIGGATGELQQGQQIAGLLNLVFMAPLLLLVVIFENPSGPLATFMTLFPPTAFMCISLRWGLCSIPTWQLYVSWVLLVLSVVGMVWTGTRIFRAGMLRYGQPLGMKAILAAVKENSGR
jgi:ABC-2 type transport system permease protein